MPPKRSFNYVRRTADDVMERASARGGSFDDFIKSKYKKYKVKDGRNWIRILPWEGNKHYGYSIFVNYGIGADNQSYLSLSKMKKEKDPLAEAKREAEREGNAKLAKALSPRERVLMWVIDRDAEEEGPQLWAAPQTVDKSIANICIDPDDKSVVYLDDPNEGYDLRFHKEGKGLSTTYDASKMRLSKESCPISDDQGKQDKWLQYISENPLPDCVQFYDYKHIAEVFNGSVRVDEDDSDDRPRKPKVAAKPPWEDSNEGSTDDPEENEADTRRAPAEQSGEDEDIGSTIRARLQRSREARGRVHDDE